MTISPDLVDEITSPLVGRIQELEEKLALYHNKTLNTINALFPKCQCNIMTSLSLINHDKCIRCTFIESLSLQESALKRGKEK